MIVQASCNSETQPGALGTCGVLVSFGRYVRAQGQFLSVEISLRKDLANYVADMSPTRVNVAKSWPTLRVVATQKRDTNAQFISITAEKYKSAQTYRYLLSYNTFFCLSSKELPTCNECRRRFGHPADTTFSYVCDMTSDVSRHVADTTQIVAVWAKTTRRHLTGAFLLNKFCLLMLI